MKPVSISLIALMLFLASCKKDPEIISGNTPLGDPTVSLTQIRQFVQKIYLGTIGVTPADSVLDAEIKALATTNCSSASRSSLVDRLMYSPAAMDNYYAVKNQQLLDGADADYIDDMIDDIQREINDPANAVDVTRLTLELNRMEDLRDAYQEFKSGAINMVEVERRMAATRLFQWVNGSGETWVEVVFDFFLLRKPTDAELENATSMLYGTPGVLFLQTGISDSDFLQIFFTSRSFYEGQVREMFRNNMFREPSANELLDYTNEFSSHKNHLTTMRKIFLSNEFLRGY